MKIIINAIVLLAIHFTLGERKFLFLHALQLGTMFMHKMYFISRKKRFINTFIRKSFLFEA